MKKDNIKYTTRPAEIRDAERMLEIHHNAVDILCRDTLNDLQIKAWMDRENIESMKHYVNSPDYQTLVAENDGGLIGFCSLSDGEIKKLFISPDFSHGYGVGTRLITETEELYCSTGEERPRELVVEASLHACGFYSKMGFKFVEAREYHMPNGSDITVNFMKKEIKPIQDIVPVYQYPCLKFG